MGGHEQTEQTALAGDEPAIPPVLFFITVFLVVSMAASLSRHEIVRWLATGAFPAWMLLGAWRAWFRSRAPLWALSMVSGAVGVFFILLLPLGAARSDLTQVGILFVLLQQVLGYWGRRRDPDLLQGDGKHSVSEVLLFRWLPDRRERAQPSS